MDQKRLARFLIALGALDQIEATKPYPQTEDWNVEYQKVKDAFTQQARWYGHHIAENN